MAAYWKNHRLEIISWVIVGVLLIMFLAWCWYPQPKIHVQPATPVLRPRRYPDDHDVELAPLPRAFVPLPLYENHERDVWVPDYIDLEKHADGYHYPRHLDKMRIAGHDDTWS
ncbi:hypothetical protein E8E12_007676 [Didymella heteroderae]|uniref:Uncharacterized protein n=1 Tax=Didymella heteroderae TaxID=1769908 RepID=A0A9P4WUI7_9PLEO|nr:hypothetical protein E8E12_007676 [Didymella heteroderae]